MTKEELINKIWDCYIDIHNSCGMITDEESMQKSIKLLDEYELSKLHQPTVISSVCDNCRDVQGMYLGMTCPKCNRPFRDVKQTDL